MKYCTHCGKELFDEAVMCPGCGTMTVVPAEQKKKVKEKRPVNKKKVILITVLSVATLLVIAGGIFGFLLLKCNNYARELEAQLADKTFECKGLRGEFENYQVNWVSFYDSARYRNEFVDFTTSESNEWFGDFYVEVGLNGVATIHADSTVYIITTDASGDIEMFADGMEEYYPIEREFGRNLLDWFNEVQFEEALERNKEEATEMFANISYWDTGDKFDNLIPIIFKEYNLTCEPLDNSNTEFIITISGRYYFNKVDLPTLTREGELVCHVTVNEMESALAIKKDEGIIDAMNLYVVLSTYRSYGW